MISRFSQILFFAMLMQPFDAIAQTITESWLRTATSSCGGGMFVEVEGEFEADLFKRLGLIAGSVEGEGRYEANDVKNIFEEFGG